jgi:hypothetical protein
VLEEREAANKRNEARKFYITARRTEGQFPAKVRFINTGIIF